MVRRLAAGLQLEPTAATPTDRFYITDTLGDRFRPIANPTPNPYSYVPVVDPGRRPAADDLQRRLRRLDAGEFLIFKVPYADLPNRPFILHIVDPADTVASSRRSSWTCSGR